MKCDEELLTRARRLATSIDEKDIAGLMATFANTAEAVDVVTASIGWAHRTAADCAGYFTMARQSATASDVGRNRRSTAAARTNS